MNKLIFALPLAGLLGCDFGDHTAQPKTFPLNADKPSLVRTAVAADPRSEALDIFKTRCASCHGAGGAGDGPVAAALNPKPASFASSTWQQAISDEQIEKVILAGGAAVGKSVVMPANPDLDGKVEVVRELRVHVRGLGPR